MTGPQLALNGANYACGRFSFGVTMWALMNGTTPWPQLPFQDAARRHCNGKRLPPPLGGLADDRLWGILQRCWAQREEERPSMAEVRDELATRLEELRKTPAATTVAVEVAVAEQKATEAERSDASATSTKLLPRRPHTEPTLDMTASTPHPAAEDARMPVTGTRSPSREAPAEY